MKKIFATLLLIGCICNIQAQKKTFEYYYELGRKLMDSEDYSKAKLYYDTSILKKPNHANSYFNRGLCYGILDDTKSSLEDFTKYIKFVPNDPDAYEQIGNLKRELKDTAGTLSAYDSCLKYDPSNFDVRISRAKMYWMLDSFQISHKDFNYAYHLDTNKVEGIYFKGVSHFMIEQYDSAITYLNLSIKKDTNYVNALYYLAYSKYEKNDFDKALSDINLLIGKVPKDPDYLILRALIYLFNSSEYDDNLASDDLYEALKLGSERARKLLDEYFSDEEEDN